MAALSRPSKATYEVHEQVTVDTSDNEDHTFCGIMFPIKCRDLLPLHHLVINSVAVRGQLGPMTVWVYSRKKMNEQHQQTSNSHNSSSSSSYHVSMNPRDWIKIYEKRHPPSPREYQRLEFQTPILVKPGQVVVLYIHSTLQGDEAIVYDNLRPRPNQRGREPIMRHFRNAPPPANQRVPVLDRCVEILPARAHVSNVPFGSRPIWGWGFAWRDDREFVGRIEYGCVYRLWNPTCHVRFATGFNKAVQTMLLCQRRDESQMSRLPDDCIYYILNMCRWDWFNDGLEEYQQARRQRLSHRRVSNAQQMMETASASFEQAEADPPAVAAAHRCDRMRTSSSSNVAMVTERQLLEGDIDVDDDDDDDDDDGDFVEDDEDDDNNDEDDDEDEEEDEEDGESEAGTVNGNFFRINAASDDEGDDGNQDNGNNNDEHDEDDDETSRAWIRRQFARLHVLRALAAMEDNADVEMNS